MVYAVETFHCRYCLLTVHTTFFDMAKHIEACQRLEAERAAQRYVLGSHSWMEADDETQRLNREAASVRP